jgi:hypothetical protein
VIEVVVPGFLPSTHGLHFANRFAPGPTVRLGFVDPRRVGIGDAAGGLCGGMCRFVRERFEAGLAVPQDRAAPANGSPLFQALVRQQVRSLRWLAVPLLFWRAAAMSPDRLLARSLEHEWPRIRSTIDSGRLAQVGLVRHHGIDPRDLVKDHQVVAYGYTVDEASGAVTLRIYDPNWPDRDDVSLTLAEDRTTQSTGEALLGVLAL